MDRHLLFPNSLNSDYKLTRAASFSELSSMKKVVYEEGHRSEASGNLFKQYSCEQIFNQKLNTSRFNLFRTLKSDDEETVDIWKSTVSMHTPLKSTEWTNDKDESYSQTEYSFPNDYPTHKGTDYLTKKQILALPTFVNEKNNSQQNFFYNYERSIDEKFTEPAFEFKKPLPYIKKSNILNNDCNIADERIDDNSIVYNYGLPNQLKRNVCKNVNKQKTDTSELKTKIRSLVNKKPKQKENRHICWYLAFIVLIPLAFIYIAFLFNDAESLDGFCNPHFKFYNVTEDLKNRIHGQDAAIDDLAKYFKQIENQTGFHIVSLIGGTGVGKSYTAEIIKNNLLKTYNILDIYPPFYEKESQAYTSLSVCECNLIRLENIKTDDIPDSIQFVDNLNKRVNNYCILILALFNTQETDYNLKKILDIDKSLSLIDKKFEEIGLQSTLVSFIKTNDESLIKCIKDAADYTNMELSNDDIEYVKQDLLRADSGCKGAYAKVQLVGKIKDLSEL